MVRRENQMSRSGRSLRIVTVFALLLLFFLFFVAFFDCFQLERAGRDDFKIGPTLRARNHFALVDIFLFDVQISFAFGTKHHKASLAYQSLLIIFRFSPPIGQGAAAGAERFFPKTEPDCPYWILPTRIPP